MFSCPISGSIRESPIQQVPTTKPGNVVRIMEEKMKEESKGETQGLWVDYCSIAQNHDQMQNLAVDSLPCYASN